MFALSCEACHLAFGGVYLCHFCNSFKDLSKLFIVLDVYVSCSVLQQLVDYFPCNFELEEYRLHINQRLEKCFVEGTLNCPLLVLLP